MNFSTFFSLIPQVMYTLVTLVVRRRCGFVSVCVPMPTVETHDHLTHDTFLELTIFLVKKIQLIRIPSNSAAFLSMKHS